MFPSLCLMAQGVSVADSFTTDRALGLYQYRVHMPLGQTFVNCTTVPKTSTVRFHLPNKEAEPLLLRDTLPGRLRTTVSLASPNTSGYSRKTTATMRGAVVQYDASGSMTVDDDPARYLMELRPDTDIPLDLEMNLGYGSAWLDLTNLDLRTINISSGAADVYISYKNVGKSPVREFIINGGMAKVVVRNLEMARAENVYIENGMGDTKLIVGDKVIQRTNMRVIVGTGTCTMLADQDVPIRLIMNSNVFSSVEIPADFVKTRDGTFVNLAFKKSPERAMTVTVDPGLGKFVLVSYE
ncbi:MAG: hypothetical protein AAF998_14940 [Bacteroidota bacterium]